jgi:hypothetical protein
MAINVKSAAAAATKFVQAAQSAGPAYTAGVQNAGASWATNTAASAQAWQQGVSQAVSDGRFAKGVNQTSQNKYQVRAAGVGAQRYGPGVAGAQQTYQTNVAPYLATIAQLNLPARQPKGSPANIARVQAVTQALRAQKLGGGA